MPSHDRSPVNTPGTIVRRVIMRRTTLWLGAAALMLTVACWPTTRSVGTNFVVTQQQLPLWVKAMEFIDRDINLERTADAVLAGVAGDEAKVRAALAWTIANVKPAPPGLAVVDDHIWNIVVRGYGTTDQQADVFTTLLSYSGVPAFWTMVGREPDEIPISYAKVGGRWCMVDVRRDIIFRTASGTLVAASDAEQDPAILQAAVATQPDAEAYLLHFAGFHAPPPPDELRADMQRPLRRLSFEMRRLIGVAGRTWEMRPQAISGAQP
jgi:hypothetical protein